MRIPIQYALTYPERLTNRLGGVDFYTIKKLNFSLPDFKRFPCLELAYRVAEKEGTLPAVLNAANEISVQRFLKNELDFIAIPKIIEKVLNRHHNKMSPDLDDILEADKWAREETDKIIHNLR
jgi:1-deoxy-D-xylulose-5-phosphate reductoisomerase